MRILKAILALPFALIMIPMRMMVHVLDWMEEEIIEWVDLIAPWGAD